MGKQVIGDQPLSLAFPSHWAMRDDNSVSTPVNLGCPDRNVVCAAARKREKHRAGRSVGPGQTGRGVLRRTTVAAWSLIRNVNRFNA